MSCLSPDPPKSAPSALEALENFAATLPPKKQGQLRNSYPFFALLVAREFPHLPTRQQDQSITSWLAAMPMSSLMNTTRLLEALHDPCLAAQVQKQKSSLRAYRTRLRPFLEWLPQYLAIDQTSLGLSPAWAHLLAELDGLVEPKKRLKFRAGLRQLALFAAGAGRAPAQVDTPLTAQLRGFLFTTSSLEDPGRYYRNAEYAWELLVPAGLVGPVVFYHPPVKERYVLRPEELPAHLKEVYDDILACLRSSDPDRWLVPPRDNGLAPVRPTNSRQRKNRGRRPRIRRDRPLTEKAIDNYGRPLLGLLGYLKLALKLDLDTLAFPDLFQDQYLQGFGDFLYQRAAKQQKLWHLKWRSSLCYLAETYLPRRWPEIPVDLSGIRDQLDFAAGMKGTRQPQNISPDQVELVLDDMERTHDRWLRHARPPSSTRLLALLRDRFTVAFLLENGVRAGNLRSAEMGTQILQTPHGYTCAFSTKNRRELTLDMSPRVLRVFADYMDLRVRLGLNSPFLLISHDNEPITHAHLWAQIQKWFKRVLHVRYSPHDFRRTLATRILRETGDIDLAKIMLFDSSEQVISGSYDMVATEEAFQMYHALLLDYQQQTLVSTPPVQELLDLAKDPQRYAHICAEVHRLETTAAPRHPEPRP